MYVCGILAKMCDRNQEIVNILKKKWNDHFQNNIIHKSIWADLSVICRWFLFCFAFHSRLSPCYYSVALLVQVTIWCAFLLLWSHVTLWSNKKTVKSYLSLFLHSFHASASCWSSLPFLYAFLVLHQYNLPSLCFKLHATSNTAHKAASESLSRMVFNHLQNQTRIKWISGLELSIQNE